MAAKNTIVSWLLNFKIGMFVKSAVNQETSYRDWSLITCERGLAILLGVGGGGGFIFKIMIGLGVIFRLRNMHYMGDQFKKSS